MPFTALQPRITRAVYEWVARRCGVLTLHCEGPGCRRFTLAHRGLRRDGIYLHDAWLCSPVCFESAVAAELEAPGPGQRYTMPRLPRMPFRLILLQRELISELELQMALQHAEDTGRPLSRVMVELGFATSEQVASALATENGCAFYALPPAPVDPEQRLPLWLAGRSDAVVVRATSDRLMLGFVERIDRGLAQMVERVTAQRVECCFITPRHLRSQMEIDAVGPVDGARTQAISHLEIAVRLKDQAIETGAESVVLGRSGQRLWARMMTAENGCVDSVFELAETSISASVPAYSRIGPRLEKKTRVL